MPPVPPDNTARLYIDYAVSTTRHTVIFRPQALTDQEALVTWVHDWLEEHKAAFQEVVSFSEARWSAPGSNVTNPIPWDPIVGTGGGPKVDNKPWFGSFVGRDPLGHRVKFAIYGVFFGDDANFRIYAGENPLVAAMVSDLNTELDAPGSIVGDKVVWKPYINLGYNAYWQRQSRRG